MARSRNSVDASLRGALAGLSISPSQPLAIAFSGGLDSSVLLHAAVQVVGPSSVIALHVHHGLQPAADGWATHCADRAHALGVSARCLRIGSPVPSGANVEGWARAARYRLLYAACRDSGAAALLTAHHADDQLETLLLAMTRGSGLDGLCGMATRDQRDGVLLIRPLLDVSRTVLQRYAQHAGLHWIEDPSNDDERLRRNAIRHQVLPVLTRTLPGLGEQLPDVLAHLRQAREVLHAQAQADLQAARCAPQGLQAFDRRGLRTLPDARIAMTLRVWLRTLGCAMPTAARLQAMSAQLIDAEGPQAQIRHEALMLRRYRDCVFAMPMPAIEAARLTHEPTALPPWQGEPHIDLPASGRLLFQPAPDGLSAQWLRAQALVVRTGHGSDRFRPHQAGRSRDVRKLWQEAGLPTWVRPALPVVCVRGRVLMAAPFGMDRSSDWPWSSPGIRLDWAPEGAQIHPELAWFGPRALDSNAMRPALKPGAAIE